MKKNWAALASFILAVGGVVGLVTDLDLWSTLGLARYKMYLNFGLIAVAVVAYACVMLPPSLRRLIRDLRRGLMQIPRSVWLLFFGQATLHDHLAIMSRLSQTHLFSRLAGLDEITGTGYHILFTHKGEAGASHPYNPGRNEKYRTPTFAYDEAETIMLLWYHAAQSLRLPVERIRLLCGSCTYSDDTAKKLVESASFAIIGSPKGNGACRALMTALNANLREGRVASMGIYTMQKVEDGSQQEERWCLQTLSDHERLVPDPTGAGRGCNPLTDYGIFMKLPNLLGESIDRHSTILVIAGCKVAGQCALREWVFGEDHLVEMLRQFEGKYFQVVLRVDYEYVDGGMPKILDTAVVSKREVKVLESE